MYLPPTPPPRKNLRHATGCKYTHTIKYWCVRKVCQEKSLSITVRISRRLLKGSVQIVCRLYRSGSQTFLEEIRSRCPAVNITKNIHHFYRYFHCESVYIFIFSNTKRTRPTKNVYIFIFKKNLLLFKTIINKLYESPCPRKVLTVRSLETSVL